MTVILPTHNRAQTLGPAIQSVLNQALPSHVTLEVVVVDDHSEEDIAAVVTGLGDRRVRVVENNGAPGAASARNVGLANAKGQFIAFQDSDDLWLPGKLQMQWDALAGPGAAADAAPQTDLQASGRAAWCYGDMTRTGSNSAPHLAPDVMPGRIVGPDHDYQVRNIGIQTCLLKRHVVDAVGRFDERFPRFTDLEWLTRVALAFPGTRIGRPLVAYADETPGSISQRPGAAAEARQLLLQRHGRDVRDQDFHAKQRAEIARQWARAGRLGAALTWAVRASLRGPRLAMPAWIAIGAAIKQSDRRDSKGAAEDPA